MNKSMFLILTFALLFGAVSCSNSGGNYEFELMVGDSKILNDDFTLSFNDVVEDSRCPINVTCVWEGRAVVELGYVWQKDLVSNITLVLHAGMEEQSDTIVGPYYIKLLSVNPYPEDPNSIDDEDYIIKLLVEERE